MHSKAAYHASGGGLAHTAMPKGSVYVYDMPPRYTDDMKDLPVQWHPEQYDYDQARSRAEITALYLCMIVRMHRVCKLFVWSVGCPASRCSTSTSWRAM